ncbi:MAG: hypothetical protein EGQ54_01920, partial [[Ruminococcus] lactaris]|nr:hypothetical protein [[Ruminococcus] lactaris]
RPFLTNWLNVGILFTSYELFVTLGLCLKGLRIIKSLSFFVHQKNIAFFHTLVQFITFIAESQGFFAFLA